MRKVWLIGLVGFVILAIVQPALAQRGGGGGSRGGGWQGGGSHSGGGWHGGGRSWHGTGSHGGGWHGGGGHSHHGHSSTFFGFSFFVPLGGWWAPYSYPYSYYPYYSYPYYSYPYYYPAYRPYYPYSAPPVYSYTPPAPEVGYLYLQVEPVDAHIYVNGQYLGPVQQFAGGAAALAPGSHQVAVVAWGHRPFQQQVHVVTGQASAIRVTLQPDPAAPIPPPSPSPGTY